jgi:hypothetical protein
VPYLVVAVVLVGVIALADLVLTYGVIRRLKEHTRQLAELPPGRGGDLPELMLPAGSDPGDFTDVVAADGHPVTRAGLDDLLIGFFSPNCEACTAQAPAFVERAIRMPRDRVLVVAIGAADQTVEVVAKFEPVAHVVVESGEGALQKAFNVTGFPAMALTGAGGRIAATSWRIEDLPELAAAV